MMDNGPVFCITLYFWPGCIVLHLVGYDITSGVITGLRKVCPHFVMRHGLDHESGEKLGAHLMHTWTPSVTGVLIGFD